LENNWRVWDKNREYGQTLYKRAIGILPEMESSKKIASEVSKILKPKGSILDVGCGSGHYLRSLKREIDFEFYYKGIDKTDYYIELAKKAYAGLNYACLDIEFKIGDIYDIDLPDSSYDIVMCNNLLLHLPSVKRPLEELIRVSKDYCLVRLLCGERSYRIKDIDPNNENYDENGEPLDFYYLNIYSAKYIGELLEANPKVKKWKIESDFDYDRERISESANENNGAGNATKILGNFQVSGCIMLPWSIIQVEL